MARKDKMGTLDLAARLRAIRQTSTQTFSGCVGVLAGDPYALVREQGMCLLFGPFVLTANLILLLGGEVVLDVEGFADLFGRFPLDHVGDGLAANIKKSLNIQVVGGLMKTAVNGPLDQPSWIRAIAYQNDLEQHLLINLHELLIPLIDVGRLLARIRVVVGRGWRIGTVVNAPFNHLIQHSLVDLKALS